MVLEQRSMIEILLEVWIGSSLQEGFYKASLRSYLDTEKTKTTILDWSDQDHFFWLDQLVSIKPALDFAVDGREIKNSEVNTL